MLSIKSGLTYRVALLKGMLLDQTAVILVRSLETDGYGTEKEVFNPSDNPADTFKCRIQPQFRRPDDGTSAMSVTESADIHFVYETRITLKKEDRLKVNDRIYIIRQPLDNVDSAMANHAFINENPS